MSTVIKKVAKKIAKPAPAVEQEEVVEAGAEEQHMPDDAHEGTAAEAQGEAQEEAYEAVKPEEQAIAEQITIGQAVGVTTKQHKDGSTEETQEVLGSGEFKGPMAVVQVSMSMTKNLGNYESLKFSASISMPCVPDGAEIEDTYQNCREWVDGKVNDFNEEVSEQLGQ